MKSIVPEGRNHSMPLGMYGLYCQLESMDGIESINTGRFMPAERNKGFSAKVQYYDETNRKLRFKLRGRDFISYMELKVAPGARDSIENFVLNYSPQGKRSEVLEEAGVS